MITHNFVVFVVLRCCTHRDDEEAYVSVNGNICWSKTTLSGSAGTQLCGVQNKDHKEQLFRVRSCHITTSAASKAMVPLTVRVWANLNGNADDESFGIGNVLVSDFRQIKNAFANPNDFEGWNCGKITKCGDHQICGGYDIKGTWSEIKKTFMLPAGIYSIELVFIKIDSWCVRG